MLLNKAFHDALFPSGFNYIVCTAIPQVVVCIATDFPGADPGESEQVYPRDLCRFIRVHVTELSMSGSSAHGQ